MVDDEQRKKAEAIAKKCGCSLGQEGPDGTVQLIMTPEHAERSQKATEDFLSALDGFTQLEVSAVMTGLLAQWAGTSFPTSEAALKILGAVFNSTVAALAFAATQGMTNWPPENQTVN